MFGKSMTDMIIHRSIDIKVSGHWSHSPERSSRYKVSLSMHSQDGMKSMEKRRQLYVIKNKGAAVQGVRPTSNFEIHHQGWYVFFF